MYKKQNSNSPCWEKHNKRKILDLKNPAHIELKRKIFKAFGLDAEKTYKEKFKNYGGRIMFFLGYLIFYSILTTLIDTSIFFSIFSFVLGGMLYFNSSSPLQGIGNLCFWIITLNFKIMLS